ncbi:hypothetical protein WJX84_003671 [Apatococcus fuscideae]|uniref:Uncharacterized protein n=1 Tax=Apatococcus fuscideae TaxID=2026836 RepID=A0AAW1S7Y1_9CHLO
MIAVQTICTCQVESASRFQSKQRVPTLRCRTVLGIDLGTSNSCVSIIEQGQPRLLEICQESPYIPSVVTFPKTGGPLIGKLTGVQDTSSSFSSFKRLIGRSFDEAHQDAQSLGYTAREGPGGMLELFCPSQSSWLTPTYITTSLLQHLIGAAASQKGSEVTGAVIGVPARFSEAQCAATLQAVNAAGLHSVHLLREPIAAALACGLQHQESGAILVFDLGGGTFDLSLLESFEGILEVLATAGDTRLGGNNFDADIAKWILQSSGLTEANVR